MLLACAIAAQALPSATFADKNPQPSPQSKGCRLCDKKTGQVVVKLAPGVSISTINQRYGTTVLYQIPNTSIYVLQPPKGTNPRAIVAMMVGSGESDSGQPGGNKDIIWAEDGQIFKSAPTEFEGVAFDEFEGVAFDQFAAAVFDEFEGVAFDEFEGVAFDEFEGVAFDQFSAAVFDKFSKAAFNEFEGVAFDQFKKSVGKEFEGVAFDQFSAAAFDQFGKAVFAEFEAVAFDQFKKIVKTEFEGVAFDQFSVAVFDKFTAAVLSEFEGVAFDQFVAAVLDKYSLSLRTILGASYDQYAPKLLQLARAALTSEFSVAAFDQFAAAVFDQFSAAAYAEFIANMTKAARKIVEQQFTLTIQQLTNGKLPTDGYYGPALEQFYASVTGALLQALKTGLTPAGAATFNQQVDKFLIALAQATALHNAQSQYAWAKIGLPAALTKTTGTGVTVAVIDSGADFAHWFLQGHLVAGGFDYIDGDTNPADQNGHGTHIAGIIAQVAPGAKILPIRVLDANGEGWSFTVAEAVRDATDAGAQIVNMSLSITARSSVLEDAIDYAREHRVVLVSATGNSDPATCPAHNNCQLNPVIYPAKDEYVE
ncbi:MAG: S8 family serine peptidase, partial [Chloroflexi bacterium]|nr:S8 family serine peptidase [Chloroflexota bacterium]